MEKLIRTEELAEILGVRTNTLEIWRVYGKGLVFIKIGRAVRYRLADVEAFLCERTRVNTCESDD